MEKLTMRQQKALKTKQKILDTSLYLFGRKGFNNVTVDEIVQVSGTSKGAFYTHFKSKHEVFLEKFKEIDNFYLDFMKKMPEHIDASEQILKLTETQMKYLRDYLGKDLIRTIYTNAIDPNTSQFLINESRPYFNIVHKIVEKGQENGEFKNTISPDRITNLVTRNIRGSLYDWCLYEDEKYDLVQESLDVIKLLLEGLKATNS
ncbi:TetR/AcrR family transcriptional regulator [Chengkuizengella axinellae]|uniref:TetR/AcrR family transcriptional regulator n=1 Tax=Chengkuizengella axinellae TaxID=3064388 RepID=A0ABT9J1Y6_9BACL|nr:TetR/AcrR family transcriptional regulator [Chengkuizengella sp. 2205SS18-9]MDP5275626.1 TetR/AcrR family transcriptional regulator [Chengkuizengella sp. 2205SS18-9]